MTWLLLCNKLLKHLVLDSWGSKQAKKLALHLILKIIEHTGLYLLRTLWLSRSTTTPNHNRAIHQKRCNHWYISLWSWYTDTANTVRCSNDSEHDTLSHLGHNSNLNNAVLILIDNPSQLPNHVQLTPCLFGFICQITTHYVQWRNHTCTIPSTITTSLFPLFCLVLPCKECKHVHNVTTLKMER